MEEEITKDLKPEEAEMLARFQEELRRMTVGEHLVTMMQSLATLAVRKMGMTPETTSERDMEQTKLAIEAFKVLLPVVESSRPAAEMQAHRSMLAELQMAYVSALQQPQGAASD
jgi:hypothetical protein